MRKLLLAFIIMLFLTTPAWADNSLNVTGTRNSDGTVTIKWTCPESYEEYGTKLKIAYKLNSNQLTWLDMAEVPATEEYYVDDIHKTMPDETIIYKVWSNIYDGVEITVEPYEEVPTDDNGETDPNANDDGSGENQEGDSDGPLKGNLTDAENNASYIEKFIAKVIMIIPQFVYSIIQIDDPITLVFNRVPENSSIAYQPGQSVSVEDLHLYTFTDDEYSAIQLIYETIKEQVPIPITIAVVFLGYMMLFRRTGSNNRLTYQDYVSGLIICVALIQYGEYLWEFIFSINYYFVEIIYSAIESRVDGFSGIFSTLLRWDTASAGMAAISFVVVIVFAMMNYHYALRKIMLAVLILIFPAVAVAGIFPQTKGVLNTWLKELMANLFLQTGHAVALALFVLFTANNVNFWVMLAFLLGLNSVAMVVRRVIGAETFGTGAMGMAGTMFGLGSLLALSKIGQGLWGARGAGAGSAALGAGAAGGSSAAAGSSGGTLAQALTATGKGAAFATATLAGGALTGMALGNPNLGMMGGGLVGNFAGGKVGQLSNFISGSLEDAQATGKSFLSAAANKVGMYDSGQLYDADSAAQIGRTMMGGGALGHVGAAAGRTVSNAANIVQGLAPSGKTSAAYQTGMELSTFRKRVAQDMTQAQVQLENLMPQQQAAQLQLERAKSPEFYPNPTEQKLAITDAQANLASVNGRIADAKLTVMDGNYALSNEGIQQKLEQLRLAHENSPGVNGGVNGHRWS